MESRQRKKTKNKGTIQQNKKNDGLSLRLFLNQWKQYLSDSWSKLK